jgi:hypothetical protein
MSTSHGLESRGSGADGLLRAVTLKVVYERFHARLPDPRG